MSTKSTYQAGDIIRPLPSSYKVVGDKLIFPDGGSYHHGESFNATVISHFIVATEPLTSDDVVVLNFNLIFYDTMKSTDSGVFTNPCVTGFRYLEESDKQRLYKYADECVREAAIRDNFLPQEKENGIDVVNRKGSLASVSSQDRAKGEVVFQTTGVLLPFPVRSTVEIPGDLHVRLTGGTEFMRHSCLPNLRLEVEGSEIRGVALRPIEAGELLTFNYLCTEWEVTKVFQCSCNKYCCYGLIKGFKYLDPEQQEHLLPNCCPAVREKYCSPMLRTTSLAALNTTSSLSVQSDGKIVSQMYVAAGTVLVRCADEAVVEGSRLVLGGLRIPHSCDANTCLIEGRLVTSRALVSGDCLTFNINSFSYELNHPFDCDCKSSDCVKRVSGFKSLSNERKDKLWLIASNSARNAALKDNYKIPSSSSMVEVKATESIGQATFAAVNIPSGKCVFHVTGLVIPFPTVYTIYIGQGKHLLFAGGAQCLAHSCQPNTRIVVDPVNGSLDCFATEPIPEGKLISFNYLTTEWDMNEPFPCACGAPNCFKKIEGFAHLSKEDKLRLWSQTTSAVASRFATSTTGSILTNIDREVAAPKGAEGHLHTCQELTSGTLLFECLDYDVVGKYVYFGDVRVPHSCSPSAVFLAGKVVLSQAAPANTVITVNINHLYYTVEAPFQCDCGSDGCVGRVGGFSQLTDAQKDAIILCTDPAVREEACKNGYKNKSSSPLVDVRDNGGMGQATFSTRNIAKGTRFFNVHGLVLPFPTVYTIMLDRGRHLLFADGAQCLAHSCNPNVRIIVDPEGRSLDCLALRDINEGELISFNYLTTEWDMNSPFRCVCESANCFGKIAGFKYLNSVQRQQLWSLCSPAIKSEVNMSGNWSRLSSPELTTDANGHVLASTLIPVGTPVLSASRTQINGNSILVDGISVRHSCAPTAAIVEFRVVLIQQVCEGTEITVDVNCMAYHLTPFECSCSAHAAPHTVKGFAGLSDDEKAARIILADAVVRTEAIQDGYTIPCSSPEVVVKANGDMGQATFAATNIAAGSRFLRVKGLCLSFPTVYTILLSRDRHLLFADGAQCLAHSCDPNVQICIDPLNSTLECEALKDIKAGDLISFNYNTTEWDMNSPFRCLCGAKNCVYDIRGYKNLTKQQRDAILHQTTPAIKELAGLYADTHLPATLKANSTGALVTVAAIPKETIVMELFYMDVQPSQIGVGRDNVVKHSNQSNCVLVEGRLISCVDMTPDTELTVNMNYFVYDMTAIFPRSFSEECKGFRYLDESIKQKYLYLCEPPVRAQAMRDGWIVKSSQSALVVRPNGDMGQTAYATRDIHVGEKLFHCTGLIVPFPTMYTICVGDNKHLLFGDAAECIAHHCDPNVQVVVKNDHTFDFVTVKEIKEGEMVTFNYATTEWDMNSPFICLCGSPYCARTMQGFKHLNNVDRQRLWNITSPVVKAMCAEPAGNSPLKQVA